MRHAWCLQRQQGMKNAFAALHRVCIMPTQLTRACAFTPLKTVQGLRKCSGYGALTLVKQTKLEKVGLVTVQMACCYRMCCTCRGFRSSCGVYYLLHTWLPCDTDWIQLHCKVIPHFRHFIQSAISLTISAKASRATWHHTSAPHVNRVVSVTGQLSATLNWVNAYVANTESSMLCPGA